MSDVFQLIRYYFSKVPLRYLVVLLIMLLTSIFQTLQYAQDPVSASQKPTPDRAPTIDGHWGLSSIDGKELSFEDLIGDSRAVCFVFLYPRCPMAQEYAPVLDKLSQEFEGAGIRFVGVLCECDDSAEVEAYRKEYGISFPIHLDTEFKLARTLGATITPEVFLVGRERQTSYSGRVDDRFNVRGVMKLGDPVPELRLAILDFLAGRDIKTPRTKAVGCPLNRPELPKQPEPHDIVSEKVTFTKDVLPFLHKHCQICHSPGQAGPFNLLSYADAVEWIELALEELDARRMPPAQSESDYEFAGPKSPTKTEIAMLREWVAAEKPEGKASDTPTLAPLPNYSAFQEDLGPPDIVIDLAEPTQIGAHGNDIYRNLIFPLNLPNDLHLRAFQFLPGNRRVVHHTLLGYLPNDAVQAAIRKYGGREAFVNDDDSAGGFWDPHGIGFRVPPIRDDGQPRSAFIGGFVPGVRATVAPENAVVIIPAGCDIVAQMHYVRTGKVESDSSRLGLWIAKDKPQKRMNVIYVAGEFAVVPAGVTDFRVRGSWTIRQNADLVGVIPHTHQLARWLEIKAYLPGETQPKIVLRIPQWDYNWQSAYYLREPQSFPAGTRFEVECSYDNSTANPRNPFNPPRNIWHSETIEDEMLLPVMEFTSEKILDGNSESFVKFWGSTRRSGFLRRLVEHRYKYVADADGNVHLSPNYQESKE